MRSKMGGSRARLLRSEQSLVDCSLKETAPPVSERRRSPQLRSRVAAAKKEWDEIRGTPEGLALGPNGRPKQQPFRLKYERLQVGTAVPDRSGSRGYGVHGVREAKAHSGHGDPYPR